MPREAAARSIMEAAGGKLNSSYITTGDRRDGLVARCQEPLGLIEAQGVNTVDCLHARHLGEASRKRTFGQTGSARPNQEERGSAKASFFPLQALSTCLTSVELNCRKKSGSVWNWNAVGR